MYEMAQILSSLFWVTFFFVLLLHGHDIGTPRALFECVYVCVRALKIFIERCSSDTVHRCLQSRFLVQLKVPRPPPQEVGGTPWVPNVSVRLFKITKNGFTVDRLSHQVMCGHSLKESFQVICCMDATERTSLVQKTCHFEHTTRAQ